MYSSFPNHHYCIFAIRNTNAFYGCEYWNADTFTTDALLKIRFVGYSILTTRTKNKAYKVLQIYAMCECDTESVVENSLSQF